ncbi:ionotropic receptor 75a-like [Chrysoperla carnea]|uniref:ionotropic receptor 75a-like n=1 Tax=Chrysoperla carnea TaxID=189513 RepID=UPI001D0650DB|nr:ionotropic receptor 75a-like [Chrysoperla carnea]
MVVSNYGYFHNFYKWLLIDDFGNNETESPIGKTLAKLNVPLNADITLSVQNTPNSLQLYDIYNPGYVRGGNLTMNPDIVTENRWFGPDGGEPEGIQKGLIEHKFDISAITGLLKVDRIHMMDWSIPLYPFRTSFVFQNPDTTSISNIFLSPFTYDSWYGVLLIFILFVLIFSISYDSDRQMPITGGVDATSAAVIVTLGVLCQQGTWLEPHRNSGKFLLFSILVSSVLVYNFYTSSVVSSLLSAKPKTLDTFQELARSPLQIGLEDQPYTRTIFQVTKNPDIKYLYNLKVAKAKIDPYNISIPDGIELINKGGWAYHAETNSLYPSISRLFDQDKICKLGEINLFPPAYLQFMLPRFSPYAEMFKISQYRLVNNGIYKRFLKQYYHEKPECFSTTLLVQVNLGPITPAFFLLSVGMMAAVIIFIFENRHRIRFKLQSIIQKQRVRKEDWKN